MEMGTGRKALATAGVLMALFLAALDSTIVGTAMPRIIADLNGLSDYAWVTTAYLVTSTVMVPIAGKLGDMFGRKPFLLIGMAGFMAASWLSGLSQTMVELVLFRGVQGLFGGVLFATVFTVLADLYTVEQRTRMQGVFSSVFGLASIIGPALGGYLTDNWGWRWVFYVNIPAGVVGLILVIAFLPYVRSRTSWREIDFIGAATLTAGLVPLLLGLSLTDNHAWTSPLVLGMFVLAAVMIAAFLFTERRARNPIVALDLFRHNQFAVSVVVGFFSAVGMFGAVSFIPLTLQGVLGESAANSGTLITPMILSMVVVSTLASQVMIRMKRYRFLGTIGVAAMMVGLWQLSLVTIGTSQLTATLDIILIGAGLGLTFPMAMAVVQAALPRHMVGVATAQIQFWRNLGGTVAVAVLGSVLTARLGPSVGAQIAALHLPPRYAHLAAGAGAGSAQSALNAAQLARERAALPAAARPVFDEVVHAVKLGLAGAMHDVFLIAAALLVVALVVSFFLREVPLRSGARTATVEVVEEPAPRELPRVRRGQIVVRTVLGAAASMLALSVGVWLLISPWALSGAGGGGLSGGEWALVGTGAGLLLIALAGAVVTAVTALADLREAGLVAVRTRRAVEPPVVEAVEAEPEPGPAPDSRELVGQLARMLADELTRIEAEGPEPAAEVEEVAR
ncbi:MAG TPA: MDR family MFS transporter [Candidatus Dormibacteraeota bacterium]|jgi:EmrB/QacA subfamily drug resistance transporter|nr:MDR family MFS transporter [Candidatus Dormibacteraeota bacterium]